MVIREIDPDRDQNEWIRMRTLLWPDAGSADEQRAEMQAMISDQGATVFVADRGDGRLGGFLEVATRNDYVEGCDTSPVAYIEGWFVDADLRRRGLGRSLVSSAEHWARAGGFTEIASDTEVENEASQVAHGRLGFEAVATIVHFRKGLTPE